MPTPATPQQLPLLSAESSDDQMPSSQATDEGWVFDRRTLFSAEGLIMLQLFCRFDGEEWNPALQRKIGTLYRVAMHQPTENTKPKELVNKVQTHMKALEHMALARKDLGSPPRLIITPLGKQVYALINHLPQLYMALPQLIIQVLTEYQIYNPTLQISASGFAVFPYWLTFYVMRKCDNYLTDGEILRILYRTKRMDQADDVVEKIRNYRHRRQEGANDEEMDQEFGEALNDSYYRRNYFFYSLRWKKGGQVILTEESGGPDDTVYRLNPMFNEFIDALLQKPPRFRNNLTEADWFASFGDMVSLLPPPQQVKAIHINDATTDFSADRWVTSCHEIDINRVDYDDLLYFLSTTDPDIVQVDIARWIYRVIDIQFDVPAENRCTVMLTPAWQVDDPQFVQAQFQAAEQPIDLTMLDGNADQVHEGDEQ